MKIKTIIIYEIEKNFANLRIKFLEKGLIYMSANKFEKCNNRLFIIMTT